MLQIIEAHPNLPVYADVREHPLPRLTSQRPISSVMAPVDTTTQWREDWSSASVVDHSTVTDPTIRQPDFDLPRHTRSLLYRFQTRQGPCRANLHKWGLTQSPSCDCGQRQTMNHIVDTCPLTKFEGGLKLHEAYDDAVLWLKSPATMQHLRNLMKNQPCASLSRTHAAQFSEDNTQTSASRNMASQTCLLVESRCVVIIVALLSVFQPSTQEGTL